MSKSNAPKLGKSNDNNYYPTEYQNRQMEARRKIEKLREEKELNAEIADYPESNTALDELAKQAQELNMGY